MLIPRAKSATAELMEDRFTVLVDVEDADSSRALVASSGAGLRCSADPTSRILRVDDFESTPTVVVIVAEFMADETPLINRCFLPHT